MPYINKKKFFINFTISVFSFILIFCFIEIALRIFTPNILQERLDANVTDNSDFQNLFNVSKFHFERNSKGKAKHTEYEHWVTHDDVGFRNTCFNNKNKPSKILLIGDSFVYGLGVKNDQIISCRLTKLGIPAYSLGLLGADPLLYLKLIEKNLKRLKKKNYIDENTTFILTITLANDFESILHLNSLDVKKENLNSFYIDNYVSKIQKNRKKWADPTFLKILNRFFLYSFLSKSYFLNYTKVVLVRSGIRHSFRKMPKDVYADFGGSTYYVKNAQFDVKKFFNSFNKLILYLQHKSNNNFALLFIPNSTELDIVKLERTAKISNFNASDIDTNFKHDLIMQACAKFNIHCLDTTKILDGRKDFYKYDNHPNSLGTEKIANFLYKKLGTLIK